MGTSIKKAVVIGAGSMGSGIAAHLANAGMNVVLMDIVPKEGGRSSVAENAIQRQLATGGFMLPAYASLVRAANIEDDFADVADADWIVEAVIEDMAVKSNLYKSIEAVRKDDSIVSSNTSTIPLSHLTEGLGKRFAGDFLITHFFNPPRYMRLLELVSGPETHRSTVMRTRRICDEVLGKTVIDCRDKPGFIANRIGNYWMSVATLEAIKHGLTVEEADAVMSRGFGVPKTGIFGLFDLVGINLVPLVWRSLLDILPKDDDHHHFDLTKNSFIGTMLEKGLIGRKGKGGFYRQTGKGKDRIRETIDLNSGEYRLEQSPTLDALDTAGKNLRKLCEHDSAAGRYTWSVLKHLVCYSSEVAPSVADDVISVDTAMQRGYNWSEGPFQLADRYLRDHGIRPHQRLEINGLMSIAVMVDHGLGVSLLPDWSALWSGGLSIARVPLPRHAPVRRIGFIWGVQRPHAHLAGLFLQHAEAVFRKQAGKSNSKRKPRK
ncbi:3-hydroxyacyl-CoA dehydrogenase NAD-binding domain-containing protein [Herbaspirillum lusitanum]|uniref:3-hydroxyacyl-CoA dehydrogenase NAD-binding domain-containing protein n=1 Tax=Herbaspirillum lusitanum TaxID=213312 RepID=UPI0002DD4A23|nr:3-hydroxyacyl-CoA dehydrogenase NAD-binding domain-containing protein [Herbaspirillum lusitanum]